MAAVFLVTLYEYSPLFYISVVSMCFVVTAAMVLGWFGFDVPVILRSSDETESIQPTPEKQMVQVTNPFALELGSGPASVTEREEHRSQLPAEKGIKDFGPLPRERYPLVVVLMLAEPEARDKYNIVANVTVIHVPDDKYRLSARVLFQYLLTSQGNMYELKPLFMSADSGGLFGSPESEQTTPASEPTEAASQEEQSSVLEEDWSERMSRDCVVCQNATVNRVLLPCRHACVCDSCVSHFQHCPICRAFVLESFTLRNGPAAQR
ncbi:Cell growth regulator with RING finger domain protein 1 Cell growth regulatory gene 19 protein [Channa argus]|uniref:Cell growth regulator with RING finger domain protein 1 n=1 Tax=Channa argus TaxID=215402 RepID=A0A6G1QJ26_CHAAH|nr:Cell growth regulator with RING finger domain protein 1 Cell growth regulatory gene 19 protein [Channa argus]